MPIDGNTHININLEAFNVALAALQEEMHVLHDCNIVQPMNNSDFGTGLAVDSFFEARTKYSEVYFCVRGLYRATYLYLSRIKTNYENSERDNTISIQGNIE